MCGTGRLTEGYGAPEGAERFVNMAYLEAVSVYAFERLERELREHPDQYAIVKRWGDNGSSLLRKRVVRDGDERRVGRRSKEAHNTGGYHVSANLFAYCANDGRISKQLAK